MATEYRFLGLRRLGRKGVGIAISVGKNRRYVEIPVSRDEMLQFIQYAAQALRTDMQQEQE